MEYAIVMNFISWVLMWLMLLGFMFIKDCEKELNNPNSTYDDSIKMNMELYIKECNERSWAGRVLYILQLGFMMMSFIFGKKG